MTTGSRAGLQAPADSKPLMFGSITSRTIRSGSFASTGEGALSVGHRVDRERVPLEVADDDVGDRLVVLDEEDPGSLDGSLGVGIRAGGSATAGPENDG